MSNSSDTSTALQAEIGELQLLQLQVRTDCAALALVLYDYVLTLSLERQHIWTRKKTLVFYLFVTLRYSTLLQFAFEVFSDFVPFTTVSGCASVMVLRVVASIVSSISISVIFFLRAWAIWAKSTMVFLVLSAAFTARVVLLAMSNAGESNSLPNGTIRLFTLCIGSPSSLGQTVTTADNAIIIVFDIIVLLLTVMRTARQVRESARLGMKKGLSYFVIRDGVLYSLTIEAMVVSSLVLVLVQGPAIASLASVMVSMEQGLSAILAQRLILNLRRVEEELQNPTHVSLNLGELNFAHGSIIGNIGAPLRIEEDETEDTEARQQAAQQLDEAIELDEMGIQEVPRDADV